VASPNRENQPSSPPTSSARCAPCDRSDGAATTFRREHVPVHSASGAGRAPRGCRAGIFRPSGLRAVPTCPTPIPKGDHYPWLKQGPAIQHRGHGAEHQARVSCAESDEHECLRKGEHDGLRRAHEREVPNVNKVGANDGGALPHHNSATQRREPTTDRTLRTMRQ
jgi:hypothetical protein